MSEHTERKPLIALVHTNQELLGSLQGIVLDELRGRYPFCEVITFLAGVGNNTAIKEEIIQRKPDVVTTNGRHINPNSGADFSGVRLLTELADAGVSGLVFMGLWEDLDKGLREMKRENLKVEEADSLEKILISIMRILDQETISPSA